MGVFEYFVGRDQEKDYYSPPSSKKRKIWFADGSANAAANDGKWWRRMGNHVASFLQSDPSSGTDPSAEEEWLSNSGSIIGGSPNSFSASRAGNRLAEKLLGEPPSNSGDRPMTEEELEELWRQAQLSTEREVRTAFSPAAVERAAGRSEEEEDFGAVEGDVVNDLWRPAMESGVGAVHDAWERAEGRRVSDGKPVNSPMGRESDDRALSNRTAESIRKQPGEARRGEEPEESNEEQQVHGTLNTLHKLFEHENVHGDELHTLLPFLPAKGDNPHPLLDTQPLDLKAMKKMGPIEKLFYR